MKLRSATGFYCKAALLCEHCSGLLECAEFLSAKQANPNACGYERQISLNEVSTEIWIYEEDLSSSTFNNTPHSIEIIEDHSL
ncbi:hypothetical protein A6U87_05175 [Rhizobium sp. AC44/96]|nr:hypothetical protein A6U87_05175 [Rhizobium sp. AC44/96]